MNGTRSFTTGQLRVALKAQRKVGCVRVRSSSLKVCGMLVPIVEAQSELEPYPSNIMINNLACWEKSLRGDHNPSSRIEVHASKNKLVGTSRRLSAIATCNNSTGGQNHARNTSLHVSKDVSFAKSARGL